MKRRLGDFGDGVQALVEHVLLERGAQRRQTRLDTSQQLVGTCQILGVFAHTHTHTQKRAVVCGGLWCECEPDAERPRADERRTIKLVVLEQLRELGVHSLHVLLDEHDVALGDEVLLRRGMDVRMQAAHLLAEAHFHLSSARAGQRCAYEHNGERPTDRALARVPSSSSQGRCCSR